MKLLTEVPRFVFFTGKGGVGKTSLACATAVRLADGGKRVLLVSTDPASNVGQVFGVAIGNRLTVIAEVPGLSALEIDPQAAASAYRERIVGPVRGSLPESAVRRIEEQLSGACTTEIAAFDEFTELLTDQDLLGQFDHVVFDTAPTGHTIRLLQLPGAWSGFLDDNPEGASCLGPLAGLEKQRQRYSNAVAVLADSSCTRLILVARAQRSSLQEAARTCIELTQSGFSHQYLVINGRMPQGETNGHGEVSTPDDEARHARFPHSNPDETTSHSTKLPEDGSQVAGYLQEGRAQRGGRSRANESLREFHVQDDVAQAIYQRECAAIADMPDALRALPTDMRSLLPFNMVGINALRALMAEYTPVIDVARKTRKISMPDLSGLIDQLELTGHGLIMLMGKGGVGKTTLAAAIAVELAARGHAVNLTTSDPAAHLSETLNGEMENLRVSRIDPLVETERYRRHVLTTRGKDLDEQGRALLEEDLRSPCTEEIAVFQAFSRAIREADRVFVVMDTAPTGHTLLLLDATGAYHRDVARNLGKTAQTPMMRLQDASCTRILLVTLAETTPVLEAAELQEDLRRAGIEPWAWIVNQSLAAAHSVSPLLMQRAEQEYAQIEAVQQRYAQRHAVVPIQLREPVGVAALRILTAKPAVY